MTATRSNTSKVLQLAFILAPLACAVRAESVASFDVNAANYDHADRDLQIVDDKDCKSAKALELRFKGQSVQKAALSVCASPQFGPLTAGLYRAHFRLKMQGMLNSAGTGIILAVNGWDDARKAPAPEYASRLCYLNDFGAEDTWQDFVFDFDVHPADVIRLKLDSAFISPDVDGAPFFAFLKSEAVRTLPPAKRVELVEWIKTHPYQPLPAKTAGLDPQRLDKINAVGATPKALVLTVAIPHNKTGFNGGTRGDSTPFASLRRLLVDTMSVEPLPEPAAVVVRDVRAKKAWLRPGEKQSFQVDLHNRSGKAQSGEIRMSIEAGLGERTALPPVPFSLADGVYASVDVAWDVPATQRIWGQTAIAEAVIDGKAVSSWRTWFTIHPREVAVMIPEGFRAVESTRFQHPCATKPNVGNHFEQFAATPYDAAGLMPEDPDQPFLVGNSARVDSLARQAETVRAFAERGIASAFYLEGHGTGLKAWDLFWNHPERCGPSEAMSDIQYLKRQEIFPTARLWWLQGQAAEKQSKGLPLSADEQSALKEAPVTKTPAIVATNYVSVNGMCPEVVDNIIQGHIALMDKAPYSICRWDSSLPLACFSVDALSRSLGKTPEEVTQHNVDNIHQYVKEIRAKHPEFEFGFNGGHGELMGKREDPFDFESCKRVIDRDPVAKAVLADGGYILEEAWGHSIGGWNDYKMNCRNYLRASRAESAAYKYAGGHHGHMTGHSAAGYAYYTPDDIYKQVFSLLGGAHFCAAGYGPLPDGQYDLGIWAARFSEFFWDPKLQQLAKMDEKVHVESEAEIWSAEAGFEKDTDAGTHIYVLPLINPPVTETWFKNRFGQFPEPIRQPITVTVQVPAGYKGVKSVYLLAHTPWPEVQPLKFEADAKEVQYAIPELVIFNVAVVEFTK